MKILALSLFFFISKLVSAQYSWFTTGATWTYDVSWYGGEAVVKLEILPEDTLLNGQIYNIMKLTSIQHSANGDLDTLIEFRYLYEESNKVLEGNLLWYDFNREEGDTLEYMYFGGLSPSPFIVDSVGIIEMNGMPLQFQDIRFPNLYEPNEEWWGMRVIEGIGSISTFFFWDQTIIQPSDFPFYYLRCYEDSIIGTIHFNLQFDCDEIPWTTATSDANPIETKVYPNPSSSIIYIQVSEPVYATLSILDVHGRKLMNIDTEGSFEIEANISQLSAGIYFVNGITTDGTLSYLGKFLKN